MILFLHYTVYSKMNIFIYLFLFFIYFDFFTTAFPHPYNSCTVLCSSTADLSDAPLSTGMSTCLCLRLLCVSSPAVKHTGWRGQVCVLATEHICFLLVPGTCLPSASSDLVFRPLVWTAGSECILHASSSVWGGNVGKELASCCSPVLRQERLRTLRSEDAFVVTCVANLMEVKVLYVQQDLRYDIYSYWRFNV
jgi:hypothetical protein